MLQPRRQSLLFISLLPEKPNTKRSPGRIPGRSLEKKLLLIEKEFSGIRFKVMVSIMNTKKRRQTPEKNKKLANGNFCLMNSSISRMN